MVYPPAVITARPAIFEESYKIAQKKLEVEGGEE